MYKACKVNELVHLDSHSRLNESKSKSKTLFNQGSPFNSKAGIGVLYK